MVRPKHKGENFQRLIFNLYPYETESSLITSVLIATARCFICKYIQHRTCWELGEFVMLVTLYFSSAFTSVLKQVLKIASCFQNKLKLPICIVNIMIL